LNSKSPEEFEGRKYLFIAPTKSDCDRWVYEIARCIDRITNPDTDSDRDDSSLITPSSSSLSITNTTTTTTTATNTGEVVLSDDSDSDSRMSSVTMLSGGDFSGSDIGRADGGSHRYEVLEETSSVQNLLTSSPLSLSPVSSQLHTIQMLNSSGVHFYNNSRNNSNSSSEKDLNSIINKISSNNNSGDHNNNVELKRRLFVLLPGETQIDKKNIRLVVIYEYSLRVYSIEEEEEEKEEEDLTEETADERQRTEERVPQPIDCFFFPVDLHRIKRVSSVRFESKREGMKASIAEMTFSIDDRGLKHMMVVSCNNNEMTFSIDNTELMNRSM